MSDTRKIHGNIGDYYEQLFANKLDKLRQNG